jgi:hypothetical protein
MPEHQEQLKSKLQKVRKTPMAFALVIIILMIILMGENPIGLWSTPVILFLLGISFCLIAATYGFKGPKVVFKALFNLNVTGDEKQDYLNIFKDFRYYLIGSGWIGFILLIMLLGPYTPDAQDILHVLIPAGVCVLYGYTFAYIYCYPIQCRIENNPD